ncbi:septal ring lytic transglycosylase RlpA family protein [Xylanibacter muris]|nr:septal ring lytic transglycosylase RlpA family protein [Xylanibacter muris]
MVGFTSLEAQKLQRGKASYYSKKATGARTSSGERLHHDSLTCAHRTYPFGTMLKVTNLQNGKTVTVRVTDRGPFGRGRIIDLSWGAAKMLGMLSQGVVTVIVEKADETIIPFKPEDIITLPEFDYGTNEDNKDGLHPAWREMKRVVKEEKDQKTQPTTEKRKQTATTRQTQENKQPQEKNTDIKKSPKQK